MGLQTKTIDGFPVFDEPEPKQINGFPVFAPSPKEIDGFPIFDEPEAAATPPATPKGTVDNPIVDPRTLANQFAWDSLPDGMIEQGNLDLDNRPDYREPKSKEYPHGFRGSVFSTSGEEEDGTQVLIPQIVFDESGKPKRLMSGAEAWAHYEKTGEHLGKFKKGSDPKRPDEFVTPYAIQLHESQEQMGKDAEAKKKATLAKWLDDQNRQEDATVLDTALARGIGRDIYGAATGAARVVTGAVKKGAKALWKEDVGPEPTLHTPPGTIPTDPREISIGQYTHTEEDKRRTAEVADFKEKKTEYDAANQVANDNVERLLGESGLSQAHEFTTKTDEALSEYVEKAFPKPKEFEGRHILDEPGLMLEPNWWIDNMGEMFPASVAMVMGAGIVQTITKSTMAAAVVGGGIAAHQESMDVYRQGVKKYGEEEALNLYAKGMVGSTILQSLGLGFILHKLPPGVKSKIGSVLARGGGEGVTEGVEEIFQGTLLGEDVKESTIQALDVFPIATVMGLLTAGLASGVRTTADSPPSTPAKPIEGGFQGPDAEVVTEAPKPPQEEGAVVRGGNAEVQLVEDYDMMAQPGTVPEFQYVEAGGFMYLNDDFFLQGIIEDNVLNIQRAARNRAEGIPGGQFRSQVERLIALAEEAGKTGIDTVKMTASPALQKAVGRQFSPESVTMERLKESPQNPQRDITIDLKAAKAEATPTKPLTGGIGPTLRLNAEGDRGEEAVSPPEAPPSVPTDVEVAAPATATTSETELIAPGAAQEAEAPLSQEQVDAMNVQQLRGELGKRGQDTTGLRPALVERLAVEEAPAEPTAQKQPWEKTRKEWEAKTSVVSKEDTVTVYRAAGEEHHNGQADGLYVSTDLDYVGTFITPESSLEVIEVPRKALKASPEGARRGANLFAEAVIQEGDIISRTSTKVKSPTYQGAREEILSPHKMAVQQALTEGKPVPAEVLAEYPDLQPRTSEATPAPVAGDSTAAPIGPEPTLIAPTATGAPSVEERRRAASSEEEAHADVPTNAPPSEPRGPNDSYEEPEGPQRHRIQMPELIKMAEDFLGGKMPKIQRRLRVKGGEALGVFRHGPGKEPSIEMRADVMLGKRLAKQTFKRKVNQKAMEQLRLSAIEQHGLEGRAEEVVVKQEPAGKGKWEASVYLRDKELAGRVMAHEIGHLVDYKPDATMARGNLLGRIGSLKKHFASTLGERYGAPGQPISTEDRTRLHRQASLPKDFTEEVTKIVEEVVPGTGVTPKELLDLWNGLTSREENFDLYEYVTSLPDEVRVEIGKAAMKGAVHGAMARFTGIGEVTRKEVTEEVTTRRRPSKEEIKAKYAEFLEAEIRARKLIQDKTIRDEMERLSQWWTPFDEAADPKYTKYRKNGKELYADWVSVLFNSPGEAQVRAPETTKAFFNWLDRKPEVKAAYEAIQTEIASGTLPEQRLEDYENMLRRGHAADKDAETKAKEEAKKKRTPSKLLHELKTTLYNELDIFGKGDVYDAMKNIQYMPAVVEQFTRDIEARVMKPIQKLGLDRIQLGAFMGLTRAGHERADLANPLGQRGAIALEIKEEMRVKYGDEAYDALEVAQKEFWKIRSEIILPELRDSKLFSEDLLAYIENNEEYATFDIQKAVDAKYGKGSQVGAIIMRQYGTFQDIHNPLTRTIMKDVSLLAAARINNAKILAAEMFGNNVADTKWNGQSQFPVESQDQDLGLILLAQDGQVTGYYVPKEAAELFNRDPFEANVLIRIAHAMTVPYKKVFTENNPLFGLHNFPRDAKAFFQNAPGNPFALLANVPYAYARSLKTGLVDAFMETSTPLARQTYLSSDIIAGRTWKGKEFGTADEEIAKRIVIWDKKSFLEEQWYSRFGQKLGKAVFSDFNQFLERWTKFAGADLLLRKGYDLNSPEAHKLMRSLLGSPDFLERGSATHITNLAFIFSNARVQGYRAAKEAFKTSPMNYVTKFGMKMIPRALMYAGIGGVLDRVLGLVDWDDDDEEKEKEAVGPIQSMFEAVPQRDFDNYDIIPLGWTPDGKVKYSIMPQDHVTQFSSNLFSAILKGDADPGKFVGTLMGESPFGVGSANPNAKLLYEIAQHACNVNPYDWYYQSHVLSDTDYKARNMETTKKVAIHMWNSILSSSVGRIGTRPPGPSKLEQASAKPFVGPFLRRLIRVSDRGVQDRLQEAITPEEREQARITQAAGNLVSSDLEASSFKHGRLPHRNVLLRHGRAAWIRHKEAGKMPDGYTKDTYAQRYARAAFLYYGTPEQKVQQYSTGKLVKKKLKQLEQERE